MAGKVACAIALLAAGLWLCPEVAVAQPADIQPVIAGPATTASAPAKVVFFRTNHFAGAAANARISVGEKHLTEIPNNYFYVMALPSGTVNFEVDAPLDFGHLDFPMTLESGKTYYVEISTGKYDGFGGAFGYLLSNHDIPANSSCAWGWCAAIVLESDALPLITPMGFSPSTPLPPTTN
jgi:hypothetical protein